MGRGPRKSPRQAMLLLFLLLLVAGAAAADRDGPKGELRVLAAGYNHVELAADGSALALAGNAERLAVYDDDGALVWELADPGGTRPRVALSGNGSLLAFGYDDLSLVELANGTYLLDHVSVPGTITDLALSRDSAWLAVASGAAGDSGEVRLYATNGSLAWSRAFAERPDVLALSDHGERLAAGFYAGSGDDAAVELYGNASSIPLMTTTLAGRPFALSISGNGSRFGAVGRDNGVTLWEGTASDPLWRYDAGEMTSDLALSADGRTVAAATLLGEVLYFTNDSGTPTWSRDLEETAFAVDLSRDGNEFYLMTVDHQYLFRNGTDQFSWRHAGRGESFWRTNQLISDDGLLVVGTGSREDDGVVVVLARESPVRAFIVPPLPSTLLTDETLLIEGYGTDELPIVELAWSSDRDGDLGEGDTLLLVNLSAGLHTLSLIAHNDGGQQSAPATVELLVHYRPQAFIDSGPAGLVHRFMNLTWEAHGSDDEGAVTLAWSLDDLMLGSGANFTLPANVTDGSHALTLVATDARGASSLPAAVNFNLTSLPLVTQFVWTPAEPVQGQEINFTFGALSHEPLLEYRLLSDLGTLLAGSNATRQEAVAGLGGLAAGNRSLTLQARNSAGWSMPLKANLTVAPALAAQVVALPATPVLQGASLLLTGVGVPFTAAPITGYEWRLGDDLLATTPQFDLAALPAGNHTLSFRVRNADNLWSAPVVVVVTVKPPPDLDPYAAPTQLLRGATATLTFAPRDNLTANLTVEVAALAPGGDWVALGVASRDTDFQLDFTPAYGDPAGGWQLRARAVDPWGYAGAWVAVDLVVLNHPPQARDPPRVEGIEDQPSLLLLDSYASDAETATLAWLVVEHDPNVVTVAVTADRLTVTPLPDWYGLTVVTLTARDGDGATTQLNASFRFSSVHDPPVPVLVVGDATAGEAVRFNASGSASVEGDVASYRFDFGDGSTTDWLATPVTTHTYAEPGSYTVTLTVRDPYGTESEPLALEVTVAAAPAGRDWWPWLLGGMVVIGLSFAAATLASSKARAIRRQLNAIADAIGERPALTLFQEREEVDARLDVYFEAGKLSATHYATLSGQTTRLRETLMELQQQELKLREQARAGMRVRPPRVAAEAMETLETVEPRDLDEEPPAAGP